jgi:hypothetical protein
MAEQAKAFASGAEGKKEMAFTPLGPDKCFLCGLEVGEAAPRQFYPVPGSQSLMLAHTPCLNMFYANGEVWPPEEKKEKPTEPLAPTKMDDLGDVRRASYGNARLIYTPTQLVLSCDDLILRHGLKKVIPDLVVALQAVAESL